MAVSSKSTINLGLPAIPETTETRLFYELVRVYNAIQLLAQYLDQYTSNGVIVDLTRPGPIGSNTPNTVKASAFAISPKTPVASQVLSPAATDLPSVIALANSIRAALINNGIGV